MQNEGRGDSHGQDVFWIMSAALVNRKNNGSGSGGCDSQCGLILIGLAATFAGLIVIGCVIGCLVGYYRDRRNRRCPIYCCCATIPVPAVVTELVQVHVEAPTNVVPAPALIPPTSPTKLFAVENDRTRFYSQLWKELSSATLFFQIIPLGQQVVAYLDCLLCDDTRFQKYQQTVLPKMKLCSADVIAERCAYCGLALGHHLENRETIPPLRVDEDMSSYIITARYYCKYRCPLHKCKTCHQLFVKAEEFQDSCATCVVKVRSRPRYEIVRWHRFLNAYVDEIEAKASLYGLIVCKTVAERRQNAKGRGVHTVHTKVLDVPGTERKIGTFLGTIEFKCEGKCGQTWCVPFIAPKPTNCGFCH